MEVFHEHRKIISTNSLASLQWALLHMLGLTLLIKHFSEIDKACKVLMIKKLYHYSELSFQFKYFSIFYNFIKKGSTGVKFLNSSGK